MADLFTNKTKMEIIASCVHSSTYERLQALIECNKVSEDDLKISDNNANYGLRFDKGGININSCLNDGVVVGLCDELENQVEIA